MSGNPELFVALLSPDARWGSPEHPRSCQNASQIIQTLRSGLERGLSAHLEEIQRGSTGILCALDLLGVQKDNPGKVERIYQVYIVEDNLICEIKRFDDLQSAQIEAGIIPGSTCAV